MHLKTPLILDRAVSSLIFLTKLELPGGASGGTGVVGGSAAHVGSGGGNAKGSGTGCSGGGAVGSGSGSSSAVGDGGHPLPHQ